VHYTLAVLYLHTFDEICGPKLNEHSFYALLVLVLPRDQVTSPATCKNCLSVGFSATVNSQYRFVPWLPGSLNISLGIFASS
jgi:hypothetical protein